MNPKLISILVPTYRRPLQLREALASLAEQDLSLVGEILVGDDSPAQFRAENQAEIAASGLTTLVRYLPNDPPKGNPHNQWSLGEQARFDYVLLLHDDDHLCPGALSRLAQARDSETDSAVKLWFGRIVIMNENGEVDPERSVADNRHYRKDGPSAVRPVWEWCLTQSIPPNSFLIARTNYVALMKGPRDGNVGDWGLSVRLANSNAAARFIAEDISRYRIQGVSATNGGRGIDVHYTYELAKQLKVPTQGQPGKEQLLRRFAEVATIRYLRDGDRARAWQCLADWRWKRRFSPRGVVTIGMLLTPSFLWRKALRYRD